MDRHYSMRLVVSTTYLGILFGGSRLAMPRPKLHLAQPAVQESAYVREAKELAAAVGAGDDPAVVNWGLRMIEGREQYSRKAKY